MLRKELRDQVDTALIAALERAFSEVGSQDEIVHIGRLSVRARISGAGDVAGELARSIEQELRKELAAIRTTARDASRPAVAAAGSPGIERAERVEYVERAEGVERGDFAGLPSRGGAGASEAEPAVPFQTRLRMLLHYLETGSLAWPHANVDSADVLSELRAAAGADLPGVMDRLTGEPASFRARVAFWFRWLQLLPDERWPIAARAAAPPSGEGGARLVEIVAALSGEQAASLSRYARLELGAAAIVLTRQTAGLADSIELAALVLHALGGAGARRATTDVSAGGTDRLTSPPSGGAGAGDRTTRGEAGVVGAEEASVRAAADLIARLPEPAAAAFRSWLAAPSLARRTEAPGSSVDAQARATHDGAASVPPSTQEASRRTDPSRSSSRSDQPAARAEPAPRPVEPLRPRAEPILAPPPWDARTPPASGPALRSLPFGQVVHHAGLLLVHPFLARFFESTSVKEAGKPALLADELPRAAALLHLLATGEEEAFELDIDFIKVLLGLPLDAQLPVSAGLLLASDREEVEALLSAIIGHWSALKSTSVKGLRASFLQRRGLLREEDQAFRLQVEPAPFDMLLGQLPWGIGTVKLSWMKKAIFTDWPAP